MRKISDCDLALYIIIFWCCKPVKKTGLLHIALLDYFSCVNAVKRSDLSALKTQQIWVGFLYFTFGGSMCAVSEYIKIAVSWQICLSFLLSYSVNMITNPKANRISIILKSLWTKAFTGFLNSICFLTKCIFSWCLQDPYLRIILWDSIPYFWFLKRSCSMSLFHLCRALLVISAGGEVSSEGRRQFSLLAAVGVLLGLLL